MGLTLDVWAGISLQGKTKLGIYDGTRNAQGYQYILQQMLMPQAREWFEDWELQKGQSELSYCQVHDALPGARGLLWWKAGLSPPLAFTIRRKRSGTEEIRLVIR